MARLTDEAQWIIMLGFIVSISIFALALIVNQSTLIGKTTSESVLEFPKTNIQDTRSEILEYYNNGAISNGDLTLDLENISLQRRSAIVWYKNATTILIHYNDGITEYNEYYQKP